MASDSARLRNDQLQDFKYMMRLPYDIRRQIWLYLVPDEDWKLNRHAECFHDVLYGVDFGSLAKFKKQYPSPYNSLAACPESRRIGLEIMKRKFDEIEERMIWKNRSSKSTAFESHPVHGSTSALTIDARGSLVFSIDGDLDGARYYGQNLDDLVYWEWKEDMLLRIWNSAVATAVRPGPFGRFKWFTQTNSISSSQYGTWTTD